MVSIRAPLYSPVSTVFHDTAQESVITKSIIRNKSLLPYVAHSNEPLTNTVLCQQLSEGRASTRESFGLVLLAPYFIVAVAVFLGTVSVLKEETHWTNFCQKGKPCSKFQDPVLCVFAHGHLGLS